MYMLFPGIIGIVVGALDEAMSGRLVTFRSSHIHVA